MGKSSVYPVAGAGALDSSLRRWLQNPVKTLQPHVREGMTVLDVGCGPGFFTIELAKMVGSTGRVIACDFQAGMLRLLSSKIQGTDLAERIMLYQVEAEKITLDQKVDFVLAFYVVHELADQDAFFHRMHTVLKPNCRMLIVELAYHVSSRAFAETLQKAQTAGFTLLSRPKSLLNMTALLEKQL